MKKIVLMISLLALSPSAFSSEAVVCTTIDNLLTNKFTYTPEAGGPGVINHVIPETGRTLGRWVTVHTEISGRTINIAGQDNRSVPGKIGTIQIRAKKVAGIPNYLGKVRVLSASRTLETPAPKIHEVICNLK